MLFRQIDQCWIAQAPAKVNLSLRILARRPDGFHDLETVMARISLCDTLVIEPSPETELSLKVLAAYPADLAGTSIPITTDNLVLKAAERLRQHTGISIGARITLVKRIPPAAGLGGGSSNAATALAILNRAWKLHVPQPELQTLAAELGSDVPFFLADCVYAVCTGRGEEITPFNAPAGLWLVLARPASGLSTAEVYRGCVPNPEGPGVGPLIAALERGDAVHAARHLQNGLQPPAERLNNDLVRLKSEFMRLPVCGHQLTGSGSAYFGVCRSRRQALACAARLQCRGVAAVWCVSTCC